MTGTYIQTGASTYTEITGTKDIYAQTGTTTYTRVQEVYVQTGASTYVKVYEFDTTGPTVPIPTVSSGATSDTVSWTAVTDAASGVDTATLYQYFYNVDTDTRIAGNTYSIPTPTSSGSTSMAIATGRRNTPTGDQYQVHYYVVATDNAGNSTNGYTAGRSSTLKNTKPLGTFTFGIVDADSRNIGDTAWLGLTQEGIVGVSSTRAYGAWFYGTNTIKTKCRGWDADSGTIYVKRAASTDVNRGNSGTWTLQGHNLGTASGAATFIGTGVSTGAMNTDGVDATVTLDAQIREGLSDGTMQGIGAAIHTSSTAFLLGKRDFSGLITLVYNQKENI